jgi:hypothetical protein
MGCKSENVLVKIRLLETEGAQGQVQEVVGRWSNFNPIEGSDNNKKYNLRSQGSKNSLQNFLSSMWVYPLHWSKVSGPYFL